MLPGTVVVVVVDGEVTIIVAVSISMYISQNKLLKIQKNATLMCFDNSC